MEKRIEFSPAYDKRSSDPKKNYGIHGVNLAFYLIGDKGAVQFIVYTGWHLPHVQKELDAKVPSDTYPYLSHQPLPADLGYHSPTPIYEGQEPMSDKCHLLHGKCYYDGSGLNAELVFVKLTEGGSDAVWQELETFYNDVFETDKDES